MLIPKFEWKRDEKTLVQTCKVAEFTLETISPFCPESYDVYMEISGYVLHVAYIRLSRGVLTVLMCDKREVYSTKPDGYGQFKDKEREFYLSLCLGAIRLECEKCMKT